MLPSVSTTSALLTLFVLTSCFWTFCVPKLRNQEVITTTVEVNLIQQSITELGVNSSGGDRVEGVHDGGWRVVNKKNEVPKYMLDLYRKYKKDRLSGDQRPVVDVIRSLTPKSTASLLSLERSLFKKSPKKRHLLVFDIPASKKEEVLDGAELRLLTDDEPNDQRHKLGVELLIRVSLLTDAGILIDIDVQHLDQTDAWLTFNVTSVLYGRRDGAKKRTALRLVVNFEGEDREAWDDVEDMQPLLLLSYSTPKFHLGNSPVLSGSRIKRSTEAEDYEEESNNLWDDDLLTSPRIPSTNSAIRRARRLRNTCRRRPLYVDFSEIHYDTWIVAPSGYEAFQCLGKCFFPVGEHLSPTKHAIVQTLIHSVSPGKVSRACCVPTRLEPISVLYVDQRGVLTYRYNYQDMVVAECGCR